MEYEISLLLTAFATFKRELEFAFRHKLSHPKDAKASEEIRKEGNALFLRKKHSYELHAKILGRYNAGAALAPSGSQELASAYANRSAFLLHIGKYEECIQDIQKTLEITESNALKVKLLCRKVECLKRLGTNCEDLLVEAQSLVDDIVEDDKNKQILKQMITKVAAMPVAKKIDTNQEANESVDLPLTDNFLEKVSIRYSAKYGRYLAAQQNYNPGDIIFVEKLYSSTVKPPKRYTNCHYCLKTCWSGVPCKYCHWAIFCSEDCSQKAWIEYHDIECAVGELLNLILDVPWIPCSISMKIFIKAMKDAGGSVENFKAQLTAVDQCIDLCSKGFYKDGKFCNNTIEFFYSLTKKKLNSFEEKTIPRIALLVLIALLKQPRLKNMFSVEKVNDLIQNKNLLYLGSLFVRFTAIRLNNSFSCMHFLSIYNTQSGVSEGARGSCLAMLLSLINSSCCPNAGVCFTESGKVILYAVQPLKKNSQIFLTYSSEYYSKNLEDRKAHLKNYNFECDCQACTESWPPLLLDQILEDKPKIKSAAEAEFMKQCIDVKDAIAKDNYSKVTLEKLVEKIILALKCLEQPSTFTCMMLDALNACVANVYNGLKPQLLEKCKKM